MLGETTGFPFLLPSVPLFMVFVSSHKIEVGRFDTELTMAVVFYRVVVGNLANKEFERYAMDA